MELRERFQLRKVNLHNELASRLEEMILAGQFPPGCSLPSEAELARQFGVSRTVVRDATRILAAKRLVEIKHGVGMLVTHSARHGFVEALLLLLRRQNSTLGDLVDFRMILEPEVAAVAAVRASEAQLEDIRRIFEESAELLRAGEYDRAMHKHLQFHIAIIRAARNPVLEALVDPITEMILSTHGPGEGEELSGYVQDHQAILEALQARDPERARAAMIGHFAYTSNDPNFQTWRNQPVDGTMMTGARTPSA